MLLFASSLQASPVLLYHRIGDEKKPYTISAERLRSHLEYLHKNDFDLLTFTEYASKNHTVDNPAVLTFDDALLSQFRITKNGIDPDSAIGILEDFKKQHPDYRVTATFFVSTSPDTKGTTTLIFGQHGKESEKLEFLVNNGYEVAAHGHGHPDFRKLTPEQARDNLDMFFKVMSSYAPTLHMTAFAYPEGSIPRPETDRIIRELFPYIAAVGPTRDPARIPRADMSPIERIEKHLSPLLSQNPSENQ